MHHLFNFCIKALKTISTIKQSEIIEEFDKFCK
jgi:hypothetical protein